MLLSSGQIKGERKLVRVFVAKLSTEIQTKRQKEGARKQNMLFALFDHDPEKNVFLRNNSFLSFRDNFDRPIDSIPIKYQTRRKQIIIRKIFAFKTPAPPLITIRGRLLACLDMSHIFKKQISCMSSSMSL